LDWTGEAVRLLQSGAASTCAGRLQSGDRLAALYELEASRVPLRLLAVWRGDAVTDVAATPRVPLLAPTLPQSGFGLPPAGITQTNVDGMHDSQQWTMAVASAVAFAIQAEWPEHDLQSALRSGSSPGSGSLTFNATRDEWRRLSPARAHNVLATLTGAVKRLYGLTQPDRPERPIVAGIDAVETPPPSATHQTLGTESPLAQTTVVPDRWIVLG
jgi:hypothetical protein